MKKERKSRRPVLRATLLGGLVGLLFPVSAAVAELIIGETTFNFVDLFFGSPTDIVVLASPIVLAVTGYILGRGRRQVARQIDELNADRERLYSEVQSHYAIIGEVEKTQRAILDHLDSGICTVDTTLRIGDSSNAAFNGMFGAAEPAGKPVTDVVFGAWTEKQKDELREVVGLAFTNTASSDEMLNDLLPSREIVHVGTLGSGGDVKYVHVTLTRLFRNESVERVMFICKDVTLEKRFKEEEDRHQRQIDDQYKRIRQLLRHERGVTYGFLASLATGMDSLAATLRGLAQGEVNRAAVMQAIGTVHSIKGEAFSLDFDSCAEKAKSLEMYLRKVADKALGLEEHLEIIQHFEALSSERGTFERMLGRMADISGAAGPAAAAGAVPPAAPAGGGTSPLSGLEGLLSVACRRSAEELGKQARLAFSGPADRVPDAVFASLKESLLHLVRNSVAHGIEPPSARQARGKPPQGTVTICLKREAGRLSIDYADDGGGFDTEAIRAAIVARGMVAAEAARRLSVSELIRYVFVDGFSTRAETDMVAGQGVGMSVVRRVITRDLHGTMRLTQKPGRGMGCQVSLPDPVAAGEERV